MIIKIKETAFRGGVHIYEVEADGKYCTIQSPNDKQWVEDNAEMLLFGTDDVEQDEFPSQLDMIEAQVMYTAMMTDTLLEE